MPPERAIDHATQVCRWSRIPHSQGSVHPDLKPGDIWLTADGTAKIGDFGLAVAIDRSRLAQEDIIVGTVSYMPREQAMGGEVTCRSCPYSMGAMPDQIRMNLFVVLETMTIFGGSDLATHRAFVDLRGWLPALKFVGMATLFTGIGLSLATIVLVAALAVQSAAGHPVLEAGGETAHPESSAAEDH